MIDFGLILDCIDPKTAVAVVGPTPAVDLKDKETEQREQERLKQDQIKLIQQELKYKQDQLTSLQKSGVAPPPPQDANLQNVEKQEEIDQETVQHRETLDLANQLSQQNQQMQQQQQNVMMTTQTQKKTSRHWVKSEWADAKIIFNNNTEIHCDVAATPQQQASGLQAYEKLDISRGLWFPQDNRRIALFHMGSVQYPIDIIFVDGNKIAKIIDNITPNQPGSWSSICTDVIEVNGNWTIVNNVNPGDVVMTPLNKDATRTSYDPLRSLTEASSDEDWEEELLKTFPFLKDAQENKSVKPNTFNQDPGDFDGRNPTTRFEHSTLPDEFEPTGDGGSTSVDPLATTEHGGFSNKHFTYTQGFDPSLTDPEKVKLTPVKPWSNGLEAPVRAASVATTEDFSGLEQQNLDKLMTGSIVLLSRHPLEWGPSSNSKYSKEAVISDQDIDDWITSLQWNENDKNTLRKISQTDNYKKLLGRVLQDVVAGIRGFEIKDLGLHLYR